MKPNKQTIYLPVSNGFLEIIDVVTKQKVEEVKKAGELYCFTPEQLNEYTTTVIQQALKTAAEKARCESSFMDKKILSLMYSVSIDKPSITNTFEETFKQFFV
jgi:hypothetical protein